MRGRGLDPAACDLLADRCVAAAACRELAGHLPCVPQLWRNNCNIAMLHMQLCWLVLVLRGHGLLHRDVQDPAQLDHRARPHLRVGCGVLAQPGTRASWQSCTSRWACSASRFGRLALHVENGLLEIFPSVRGSSTPASNCQDERRQQLSFCCCCCCAAAWPSGARAATAPQLACTRTPA